MSSQIYVIKRSGAAELFDPSQIRQKIDLQAIGLAIDVLTIYDAVVAQIPVGSRITSRDIDRLTVKVCMLMVHKHLDYEQLARRLILNDINYATPQTFVEFVEVAYSVGLMAEHIYEFVMANSTAMNELYTRGKVNDRLFPAIGLMTLRNTYLWHKQVRIAPGTELPEIGLFYDDDEDSLLQSPRNSASAKTSKQDSIYHKVLIERPQYMFLRVAIGLALPRSYVEKTASAYERELVHRRIRTFYTELSEHRISMATPILHSTGMKEQHCSSCKIGMQEDSIESIFDYNKRIATLSKVGAGNAGTLTPCRAKGSLIKSTNGIGNGIISWLMLYEQTMSIVDQGGNKRAGSIALYLEPWHADIMEFLDYAETSGVGANKKDTVFKAVWLPDRFIRAVIHNEEWCLFSPDETPGLDRAFDRRGGTASEQKFSLLYDKYSKMPNIVRQHVKARDIWSKMMSIAMEKKSLYICAKDAGNSFSNQVYTGQGFVFGSNLCAEIYQICDSENITSCNLASMVLGSFIQNGTLQVEKLIKSAGIAAEMLDCSIDQNSYEGEWTRRDNMKWRNIAVGVQGMATAIFKAGCADYTSAEAQDLYALVAESIYFGVLQGSCALADQFGMYEYFDESAYGNGRLHYDNYPGVKLQLAEEKWNKLRDDISSYGLRNALHTAWMPTASTSLLYGQTENFEPINFIVYNKSNGKGEFAVYNLEAFTELMELPDWSDKIYPHLEKYHYLNSLSDDIVPARLKRKYAAASEYDQAELVKMAARAQPFINQGMSFNLHFCTSDVNRYTASNVTKLLIQGWNLGLKTLLYYIRRNDLSKRVAVYERNESVIMSMKSLAISDSQDDDTIMADTCAMGGGACSA
jgi:ribonucleoside-diphosphate reductase subunit M1